MKKASVLFCLVWSIFILAIPALALDKKSLIKVWHLPLNSGEVYLLETADGKNILYDTGGREEENKLISCLKQQGIRKLDLLILSHPHSSSIGGMKRLLSCFKAEQIIDSGIYYHSEWLHEYQRLAASLGIMTSSAEPGLILPLSQGTVLECRLDRSAPTVDGQALSVAVQCGSFNLFLTPHALVSPEKKREIKIARGYLWQTDGSAYSLTKHDILPAQAFSVPIQGNFILIEQQKHLLTLYCHGKPVKQYPVAVGKKSTPTPLGSFKVVNKVKKPWKPAFGVRWLGFHPDGWPAYGIHGTNEPWSIGKSVSHGCVRMRNADVLELYYAVETGTPIKIVP